MLESDKGVIEVSAVVFFEADCRMLAVRKRGTDLCLHPGDKLGPAENIATLGAEQPWMDVFVDSE